MSAFLMGAVAYDPKVVTIWNGFRRFFARHEFDFDYLLYSNYERQVDDLVAGHIDAAWNSPLAWVRARRLGAAAGVPVSALAMRDSDFDLTSVVVVRSDSGIETVDGLRGRVIGFGAVDSPQATLLPIDHLRKAGLTADRDFVVRRFEVGVGLHGDHIGGERDAAAALMAGEVDAACMIDSNHLAFSVDGTLAPGVTRVLSQTAAYDHCNMTVASAGAARIGEFGRLLETMSYGDPDVRPLLDLESMKEWRPGRLAGYEALEAAVDSTGFYNSEGEITAVGYRP